MPLQKPILLLSSLLFLSFFSMAGMRSEADVMSASDSVRVHFLALNERSLNDSVVNFGKMFLNTPYHFGSPGIASFDCSGFTSHVYRNFGFSLGRSSEDQAKQFDSIDRTQLKAGDLVFFSGRRKSKRVGHVGIVVSAKENGEFDFIHAAVHKGVTISNSNEDYYTKRFLKASRVIGVNQMLPISKFISKNGSQTGNISSTLGPVLLPVQTTKNVIPATYHQVKSGETLSSISQEYGVTIAELKQKNSIKKNKLRPNQVLKIKDEETDMVVKPIQTSVNNPTFLAESIPLNAKESSKASQNGDSHSVQKGETLFSISRLYNISVDELKKINNIIKGKIHPGQHLKIIHPADQPKKELLAKVEEAPKTATHKVLPGETLFGISKTYNVPVSELEKQNNIADSKIHPGQELKVIQKDDSKNRNVVAERVEKRQEAKAEGKETLVKHKVKKGENLGSIAKNNNTTVEELKRINNLTDSKIHLGQEIKLALNDEPKNRNVVAERVEKRQEAKAEGKEAGITHKVKKGENLGTIAKNNNTTVEELKRINNLADSKIHLGQEIKLALNDEPKNRNVVAERVEKRQEAKAEGKEAGITHKVKKGENLGSIAKNNNTTVEELKRINNLADSKIHLGQEIKLAQNDEPKNRNVVAERVEKRQEAKTEGKEAGITHKVKKGESLGAIAKNNNTTVEELERINNLAGSKIHQGQEIKLAQNDEPKNRNVAVDKTEKSRMRKLKAKKTA